MTVYTIDQAVGGYLGLRVRLATVTSSTACAFALDCQGANGYTYVNSAAPPGVNDIMNTDAGTAAVVGTWSLTTSKPSSVGTSALALPGGAGTTEHFSSAGTHSASLRTSAMSLRVYLDALPASTAEIFWNTNAIGRPTNSSVYARSLGITPSGQVQFYMKNNTTITTVTTTATVTAGAWHHLSATWTGDRVYVGVNGVVQSFALTLLPGTSESSNTGMNFGIRGGSGYGGIYVDDVLGFRLHIPEFTANFTPPTVEWGSQTWTSKNIILTPSGIMPDNGLSAASGGRPAYTNSMAGKSVLLDYTSLTRFKNTTSPALAYLMGVNHVNGTVVRGSGGSGSVRPSSGMLYPRKV